MDARVKKEKNERHKHDTIQIQHNPYLIALLIDTIP